MQTLARRLEQGGVLSLDGISGAAQPFLAALLRHLFPQRPIVLVTEGLRSQESAQQDLATWGEVQSPKSKVQSQERDGMAAVADSSSTTPQASPTLRPSPLIPLPFFYPAWEVLPHEARLPHVDVISERLETLVALTQQSKVPSLKSKVVVTSVVALLQRTLPVKIVRERTRNLTLGDRVDPVGLVEWLEGQGYEPEAQVTQKGEVALRGGILDVYPLTSPWPVRLEFFGDELESLRHFDPLTQISREEIAEVAIPPAGELGLLKQAVAGNPKAETRNPKEDRNPKAEELGILLDYLPAETVFVLCEPELLAERAGEYAAQVPAGDSFFIPWATFQEQAQARGMTLLEVTEPEALQPTEAGATPHSALRTPHFQSLDAFRPLPERAPEPAVAEAQRREFFAQLHRWLRQGWAVHVFCNNDGERQRFGEIWEEYGLAQPGPKPEARSPKAPDPTGLWTLDIGLWIHLGTLARGFLCEEAKLAVVTDAEIFGRYRVQRPRRLKSPHAQATRSALDIDFTDLEDGDYVVHVQHGIGRYLGLEVLPLGAGTKPTEGTATAAHAGQECLVIEYAPTDSAQPPPRLFVPVTEAHLVSKYVGTGKARPPLNTLGGTRWARAKEHAERAVRDVASDLLAIQAARESQAGHAFAAGRPVAAGVRGRVHLRGNARPGARHRRDQGRHGAAQADGPADLRRRRLRQDRGRHPRRVQGGPGRQAGGGAGAHDRARAAALQHLPRAHGRLPDARGDALALSHPPRPATSSQRSGSRRGGHRHRHPPAAAGGHRLQGPGPGGHRRGAALRRDAQGEVQEAAHAGGRAHAERHAHPPHALPGADGRAGHEHHPDPAA